MPRRPFSLVFVRTSELRRRPNDSITVSRSNHIGPRPELQRERLEASFVSSETRAPEGISEGSYRCSVPLIRPSKLTVKENGGVGKDLSEGWSLNFAVGCTHGCPFCYVDPIHKRFGASRYGPIVKQRWGDYFLIPENLDEAIEKTPWGRWAGTEVMMSSTHDPYLPKLRQAARSILERALPVGVRFCIQTRSFLVLEDLDLLGEYRNQIRLQVSIATAMPALARLIEPRVPLPSRRFEVLRRAKDAGLCVGVILAPIFPPVQARLDVIEDLEQMAEQLRHIEPDHIYGESLHVRGQNVRLIEEVLGERVTLDGFDGIAAFHFRRALRNVGLTGTWWPS